LIAFTGAVENLHTAAEELDNTKQQDVKRNPWKLLPADNCPGVSNIPLICPQRRNGDEYDDDNQWKTKCSYIAGHIHNGYRTKMLPLLSSDLSSLSRPAIHWVYIALASLASRSC
jgi:hypothetical protein